MLADFIRHHVGHRTEQSRQHHHTIHTSTTAFSLPQWDWWQRENKAQHAIFITSMPPLGSTSLAKVVYSIHHLVNCVYNGIKGICWSTTAPQCQFTRTVFCIFFHFLYFLPSFYLFHFFITVIIHLCSRAAASNLTILSLASSTTLSESW